MRRRYATLAVAGLITATMLAPSASAKAKPDISIWHGYTASGTEDRVFAALLARAQAHNPRVTITAQSHPFGTMFGDFALSAPTGVPDLLVAPNDDLGNQWRAGLIADAGAAVRPALHTLRPEAIEGSMVDGHMAQVPESLKAIALYYDKEQLRKPPTTTGKVLDALKAGTRLGIIGYGAAVYYAYGFYGSFGGRIVNHEGRCVADATPGVANALAWLYEAMGTPGLRMFGNGQEAMTALVNGEIAGYLEGNWVYADLAAAMGNRLGVATGPTGPGGPFQPLVGVDGYVINAASPDRAQAINVARDMTDREAQRSVMVAGPIPADRTIRVIDTRLRAFEQAVEVGVVRPTNVEFNQYWGFFGDAYYRVVYLGEDATSVVAEDCAGMNAANGF
jgi:maltose-binding protein MalE